LGHEDRVSKQAAEERYRSLRRKAFRAAEEMFVDARAARPEELTLSEIPPLSLHSAVLGWANDPARRVNWYWIGMLARYRRNYPSRFELAVFAGGEICALALGRPSATRSHCSLEFVETSPRPTHALKHRVLNTVFTALELYCVAIRAAEMRLVEPLPDLIPVYTTRHGFSVAQGQNRRPYCWREVQL
jgi:hypothetical protein